jgi:hypothetical protein
MPSRAYHRGVVCVLAVSDEVDEALYADLGPVRAAELIVACGDLPFDYLGYLMNGLDVPLVFVPGNHDPDLSGYRHSRGGLTLRAGLPTQAPWPDGAVNADGRIVDVAGLMVAGLGGCRRYSGGPNQYTDRQQARRARSLRCQAAWQRLRGGRPVDVLLTHAPPRDVGDGADPPHRGFTALHGLVGPSRAGVHVAFTIDLNRPAVRRAHRGAQCHRPQARSTSGPARGRRLHPRDRHAR